MDNVYFPNLTPGDIFSFTGDFDGGGKHVKLNDGEYICDEGRGMLKRPTQSYNIPVTKHGKMRPEDFDKVQAAWS